MNLYGVYGPSVSKRSSESGWQYRYLFCFLKSFCIIEFRVRVFVGSS